MSAFWSGFNQKAAEEQKDKTWSAKRVGLAAGTAATGGLATFESVRDLIKDNAEEQKVPHTGSKIKALNKMKPGDIIFTRAKLVKHPTVGNLPFRWIETVQWLHGSPMNHAAIYSGKGKMIESPGPGKLVKETPVLKATQGYEIKVYRPTGASKKEIQKALQFAHHAKGVPYKSNTELASYAAKKLLGIAPNAETAAKNIGKDGGLVCTSLITGAYPKRFKSEAMGFKEIRNTPGVKLIASAGQRQPTVLREKIWTRAVSPILNNLRYGVGAGLLAAGAYKGIQKLKEHSSHQKEASMFWEGFDKGIQKLKEHSSHQKEASMFWEGFDKRAYDYGMQYDPQQETAGLPQSPDRGGGLMSSVARHPLAAAGGALATGAGMYAALRKPWMKTPTLHRFVSWTKKRQPGGFRRWFDTMAHGADEIHYLHPKAKPPVRPKKVEGIVAGNMDEAQFLRGDRTFGVIKHPELKKIIQDKGEEAKFIKKYAPEYAIETHHLGDQHKGVAGLKKIHERLGGRKYFIKERAGEASGVGGDAFINHEDVHKFLTKGKVIKSKQKAMDALLKDPSKFIAQPDIGIQSSPILGHEREFRIHTLGGKVIPGTNTVRSLNIEDRWKVPQVEKHVQSFLDKLPAKVKDKDMMMGIDVAQTADGFKILELNAGGLESGIIEPGFLWNQTHEPLSAIAAAKGSQRLYRHIQGRSTPLSGAAGGLAAAGGTYAGGRYLQSRLGDAVGGASGEQVPPR